MKKLLGIVVLGLLLSGNLYADIIQNKCSGYKGYGDLSNNKSSQSWIEEIDTQKKTYRWKTSGGKWAPSGDEIIYMNHEIIKTNQKKFDAVGTYNFLTFRGTFSDASGYIQNNCIQVSFEKSQEINTQDKIAQSKQICRDLGFKVNSEKFADCALKMMSIQFEATNKVASGSGTKQEIIVKHKQDYDIWDAMLDMSNALSGSSSNNNSSSSGSSGTRCVIQKTHAWGHTVMNCN